MVGVITVNRASKLQLCGSHIDSDRLWARILSSDVDLRLRGGLRSRGRRNLTGYAPSLVEDDLLYGDTSRRPAKDQNARRGNRSRDDKVAMSLARTKYHGRVHRRVGYFAHDATVRNTAPVSDGGVRYLVLRG